MFMPQGFRNPSVMKHDFSRIPKADIPRSSFKRSHGYKTTLNTDYLIPIYVDEALPGDTFNLRLSSVARLNTPLFPIMDNLHMDFFFFAVPNRLIWNHWENFMGERQPDPDSTTDYVVPVIESPAVTGFTAGSLADYFGLPTEITDLEVNSLHFRAYNLIWNRWFRDQNLQDSVQVDKDDGPDDIADYVLLKRGKRHDYFTSCLPWPSKGTDVELPLGEAAPVITGDPRTWDTGGEQGLRMWVSSTGAWPAADRTLGVGSVGGNVRTINNSPTLDLEVNPANLYVDLESATAATINSIREAFALQKLMERDARGGSRYIELVRSHFGVVSPDYRMQYPEYLGGGSKPVIIEPIPQTSATELFAPLGGLAAIGYQNQSGIGFTKSFTEHCVIIGLVNIRADLTYQTGVNRMWSRQTKYDYYWPALAHLGEQEVLNKEIYAQGSAVDTDVDGTPDDDEIFGYQERWAEYRYYPSLITGVLRSNHATSLDAWHLSQDFGSLPVLNSTFIQENVPMDRVVYATTEPDFFFDAYFDITCTRPMPMYSVPGLIDHF